MYSFSMLLNLIFVLRRPGKFALLSVNICPVYLSSYGNFNNVQILITHYDYKNFSKTDTVSELPYILYLREDRAALIPIE
jgi:hypothetical protein